MFGGAWSYPEGALPARPLPPLLASAPSPAAATTASMEGCSQGSMTRCLALKEYWPLGGSEPEPQLQLQGEAQGVGRLGLRRGSQSSPSRSKSMSLFMALPVCLPLNPCVTPLSRLLWEAFLPALLIPLALLNMASVPREEPPCLLSPHQSRWSVTSPALAMTPSLLPSNGIPP